MKRIFTLLMLCIFGILLACSVALADFDAGFEFYKKQDYKSAMNEWKKSADAGDGQSMAYIGMMYSDGAGVKKDYKTALEWLKKASDVGDPTGTAFLAVMYAKGIGVSKSPVAAYKLIQKVESIPDYQVQDITIDFYLNGWGTEVDYEKAMKHAELMPDSFLGMDFTEYRQKKIAEIEKLIAESNKPPHTAADLISEAKANRMRFDKTFKGQRFKVVGKVNKIEDKGAKGYQVQLEANDNKLKIFEHIDCYFPTSEEDDVFELNKGDVITIEATYKGKEDFEIGAFVLYDCKVVK